MEHVNATAVGATMNEYNNTFKAMTLTSLAVGLHTIQLHGTCERNSSGRDMNEYNNSFKAMMLTSLAVGLQSNYMEHVNVTAVGATTNE